LQQDIRRRLAASVPVYLARDLHATRGGYIFTAMTPAGYRVLDQTGRDVWVDKGRTPRDQLSAATAENASVFAMELADATASRIIIMRSTSFSNASEAGMTMDDGESPALSPDGQSMAFLRETRGKGALWIAHPEDREWGSPIRLVAGDYDVRNVTFTDSGGLLFAAKWNGRIRLFSIGTAPGSQPSVFWAPDEDVASPALSPDGRFVAFTLLVKNRWQLGYLDATTRQAKMLTFGDCNASGPGWIGPSTIAYATDCGRGFGLTALTSVGIHSIPED
jgi:Tol biopolymer transport system component